MEKSLEEIIADRARKEAEAKASQNGAGHAPEPRQQAEEAEPLPEERPAEKAPALHQRERMVRVTDPVAKEPPNVIASERAILGCVIHHPSESIPILSEKITEFYFYSPAHQLIFSALLDFFDKHGAEGYRGSLDLVVLEQYLKSIGYLDKIGGESVLRGLFAGATGRETLIYHVEEITKAFVLRDVARFGQEIGKLALEETVDPRRLVDLVQLRSAQIAALSIPEKTTLSVRTLTELVGMKFDDTDNYFGDRIMAAGAPCTLLGPGGVGKSRLSLQLAVCMITGRPFLDMPTMALEKSWLFIQTENNNRRLQFDLKNIVAALKLSPEEVSVLNSRLFIHTLENDQDSFLNLIDPGNYAAVHSLIQSIKPDFVQWDPLNSLTHNDLNNDMDMRAVVTAISRITRHGNHNRVPLVLHHSLTGKAGAARSVGWDKSSYGRNSKVLQAWTRAQINLSPRSPDDPNLLVLSCGKNNNGKMFPEIGVEFHEELGIYFKDDSFDPDEFREEIGISNESSRRKKVVTAEDVSLLCGNDMPKPKLVGLLKQEFGIQQRAAYDAVDRAVAANLITKHRGTKWPSIYSPNSKNIPHYDD